MRSQSFPARTKRALHLALALASLLLASTGIAVSATALETLEPVSASVGECPALTAVKYPWIKCQANAYGGVALSIPGQPTPRTCNLPLPDGTCAAGPYEWRLVPQIPPSLR